MKILTLTFALALSLFAKDIDLSQFNKLALFQQNHLEALESLEIDGLYYIKVKRNNKITNIFLSKNKKVLIQGEGMYLKDGTPVIFKMNTAPVIGKESFSFGTGKKVLYVFTDPECPYCRKFNKAMHKLKDKYTFKVYLFPLSFHKNARAMSEWILSAKNDEEKARRLYEVSHGSTKYSNAKIAPLQREKATKLLDATIKLGNKISISGTPTVFDREGNMVNWPAL